MSAALNTVERWTGPFGWEYTARNAMTVAEMDNLYVRRYGMSRSYLNEIFLGRLPRDIRILEVGCNIGNQLLALQQMEFTRLAGIDVHWGALEMARNRSQSIEYRFGSALDIPFRDGEFDLVFTSGVLIHISPEDLPRAMSEIARVSSSYIWGCEYFSEIPMALTYRGCDDLLWKANFADLYLSSNVGLHLTHLLMLPYQADSLTDAMFLLEK